MVERYNIYPYDQYSTDDRTSPTGAWVRYEDYEALEAQLATTPSDEACLRNEKVRALVDFTKDMSIRALSGDHSQEELCAILSYEDALFQRDCDIVRARAALDALPEVKE
jgi:hypothetical protein